MGLKIWAAIMAAARMFDTAGVIFGVIVAFTKYDEGDIDKAIFWMLAVMWFGRNQVKK